MPLPHIVPMLNCLIKQISTGKQLKCISALAIMVQTPEPATKKPKGDIPRIGTHNGTFHCDEALACFQLKLLPEFHNAEIIR